MQKAIPAEDLVIHEKIAAGGAGSVWSATYRGKPVAAKQLYSNMIGVPEESLLELANEVRCGFF